MFNHECSEILKENSFIISALLEVGYDLFHYDGKCFPEYPAGLWRLVPAGAPIIDFLAASPKLETLLQNVVNTVYIWNTVIMPSLAVKLRCERSFFCDEEDLERIKDIGFAYLRGLYVGSESPKLFYAIVQPGVILFKGTKHGKAN